MTHYEYMMLVTALSAIWGSNVRAVTTGDKLPVTTSAAKFSHKTPLVTG